MMAKSKILRKDEQLLKKLQSILKLYKNFHAAADEEDKLVILEALENIRQILTRTYITERLRKNDLTEIEEVLKDLKSHVKAMALGELFSELNEIKMRMDLVETRFHLRDTTTRAKMYFNEEDDDEIWSRISAKRKEILGQSSLRLKTTLPRHMYKVRFDLPGSPAPVRAGSDVGNQNQNSEETSDESKERVKSTYQILQDRINSLQGFLEERKMRLASARRRTKISSELVNLADYTIQQSKRELQRAKDARSGNLSTIATSGVKSNEDDLKHETSQGVKMSRCEECKRWLRERDKFWGLESDSEEEDIKEFHKHVRRRSLRRDSRPFETTGGRFVGMSSGSSRRRTLRAISGRGTWTTPAYVQPWGANETNRSFGHKQGILQKFWTRLTRHHYHKS